MKMFKIIGSGFFQIISIIFVFGYLFGILNIYFSDRNNYCVMTYMFEYPQFVRISVPENAIYPQYGLHAYSEGRLTEKARKMWFDGIPVLYLPGNSGSHMQARSIASVALRKGLAKGYENHFDFFTISYNEELSGLYGGVLQSQTDFAAACIRKILSLYKGNKYTKTVPDSVILIGHSMGGLIAKRLQVYPPTLNMTSIAITLAAPLEAPVLNFDVAMNQYYKLIDYEWKMYVTNKPYYTRDKLLLSFGSGPRDILMPSGLTSCNDSFINALTTSIPGVWVSPDHVSIVWCKQLVMAINKFLFDIIDTRNNQISEDNNLLTAKVRQYFQANRSMTLSPSLSRPNVTMIVDAFWYEDNRRIYQISRPDIDKITYLMIRLVKFPQNRFAAIESVNVDDKDWIFGCAATLTYNTYRYCKQATSLTELSRWSGAATDFGKRKLATVNLHNILEHHPNWTHVIVKVSPTRKPITLNVDINDLASRQVTVDLPVLPFSKTIVKHETEANSLYYELLLPEFDMIHQAYLLYVEPTNSCKASQYHVTAEVHVPWAKNHEYFHYFTHLKHTPMKLRLFKSNPSSLYGLNSTGPVKVTLLLDPKCTFTISVTTSYYHRLAQFVRHYTPMLIPYIAAIVLLAVRTNVLSMKENGSCLNIHSALMSEGVKPYYALVFGVLGTMVLTSIPQLRLLLENASWNNIEIQYFTRSVLMLPVYMIALGIINVTALAVLLVMVFSSQLAHRLLFRIMWRGGSSIAEKFASGLQKVPMVVSAALVCAVPLSCGAASLVAGAAFYAFMLSKMYEEYLEDYVYKLMAKVAARICRMFKKSNENSSNRCESPSELVFKEVLEDDDKGKPKAIESVSEGSGETVDTTEDNLETRKNESGKIYEIPETNESHDESEQVFKDVIPLVEEEKKKEDNKTKCEGEGQSDVDEQFNNINFHTMLFLMWITVTLANIPALLTWARNFKYTMLLQPDTSYHTGLVMSVCSTCIWQMDGPRKKLRHYESLAALLFTMAVFLLVLGPYSVSIINYSVTFMFTIITLQQLFDREELQPSEVSEESVGQSEESKKEEEAASKSERHDSGTTSSDEPSGSEEFNAAKDEEPSTHSEHVDDKDDCECNENRIFNLFKTLKEKFSVNEDL